MVRYLSPAQIAGRLSRDVGVVGKDPRNTSARNVASRDHKMGKVGMKIRIMPKGMDVDMERLEKEVRNVIPSIRIEGTRIAPVAFGLKALEINVVVEDEGSSMIEDAISSIKDVQRVDIVDVGLI